MSSESANIEKFNQLMKARPSKQASFIYQAVILSLAVHIFIFAIMYLSTVTPENGEASSEDAETLKEIALSFAPEEPLPDPSKGMSEEVANLLAQSGTQRTNERVNYTGKSQEEIQAEVLQNLKNLEQAEKDALKTTHKDYSVKDKNDANRNGENQKNTSKENYDWFKNQSNKSYDGPVSAEYNLAGRTAKSTPRPTYRCKTSGKVIVNIEVNNLGEIINASLDERSTPNECIRAESLSYAKRWKFDVKDATKKQTGSITFTFTSQ